MTALLEALALLPYLPLLALNWLMERMLLTFIWLAARG